MAMEYVSPPDDPPQPVISVASAAPRVTLGTNHEANTGRIEDMAPV
jgi:hypothetical protein